MFKYLFLFAALLSIGSPALAQTDSRTPVYIGPMFMPGAAVSAGPVLDGTKTSSQFAWSLGGLLDMPISASNGLVIGVAYDQRAINFHNQANESIKTDYTISYLAIRPELRLSSFLIGLGLGVPTSASYEIYDGSHTYSGSASTGSINMLAEVRVGAALSIVDNPAGKLNLMIEGAYPLTKLFSNKPQSTESKNNGPIATLELGLSYLFNVSK